MEREICGLSVYELRYFCVQADLNSFGTRAILIICLLGQAITATLENSPSPPTPPTNLGARYEAPFSWSLVLRRDPRARRCPSAMPAGECICSRHTPSRSISQPATDKRPFIAGLDGMYVMTLPIPQHVWNWILWGEYIDFDEILPEALGSAYSNTVQIQLSRGSDSTVRFVFGNRPHDQVKPHTHDLVTWLEVLDSISPHYLDCSSVPHQQVAHLPGHHCGGKQKILSQRLTGLCQFHTAVANNQSLQWDSVEPTIWQLTMTGKLALLAQPATCRTQANQMDAAAFERVPGICWACGNGHIDPPWSSAATLAKTDA